MVYREDNVMVFDSQVLEYLQEIEKKPGIDSVELLLFRHQQNLRKKDQVEEKISKYVEHFKTFASFAPPLTMAQLYLNAYRLKTYIRKVYCTDDQIAVICRGDLSTCLASIAFRGFPNSRILYDNRGLPVEESLMAHPSGKVHALNRKVKMQSTMYAKDHCDMYNFVTEPMRDYDIAQYHYSDTIPYTIIPTLYRAEKLNPEEMEEIARRESWSPDDYIVTYVGSAVAWQSTEQLVELIRRIDERYPRVRYFILTNGAMPGLEQLPETTKQRLTVKSVPHKEMKYYLHMSNIGIVIRDDNIVNQVAAPTKIAEYLTSGIRILYSGNIGILTDLRNRTNGEQIIHIDADGKWMDQIGRDMQQPCKQADERITEYFDMETRQDETLEMIRMSFKNIKVR